MGDSEDYARRMTSDSKMTGEEIATEALKDSRIGLATTAGASK